MCQGYFPEKLVNKKFKIFVPKNLPVTVGETLPYGHKGKKGLI